MAPQLHLTEIGRVALPSPDQEKALQFFRDTLGFEVRMDETFADGQMRWIEVVPPASSTAVAIAPPPPGGDGKPVDSGIVISTTDIEADHQALKEAGVDVDDEIMRNTPPVPPMFFVRDPNGNSLLIVQPLN
jgi:catechol 2,3-dioxygenase-like lactoylglutathione lyase family enzyme